eukprot:3366330-Alexandrium_andersonii.AAC.1
MKAPSNLACCWCGAPAPRWACVSGSVGLRTLAWSSMRSSGAPSRRGTASSPATCGRSGPGTSSWKSMA